MALLWFNNLVILIWLPLRVIIEGWAEKASEGTGADELVVLDETVAFEEGEEEEVWFYEEDEF